MPNIGDICGIVFFIFNEIGQPHHKKHVLVKYGNYKANYDITTRQRLNGNMPIPQERLILKLLFKHQDEFLECWSMLNQENSVTPQRISFN